MGKPRRLAELSLGLSLLASSADAADPKRAHDLMPAPAQLKWGEGRLALDSAFTLGLTGAKDERILQAAARWILRLEKRSGIRLAARAPGAGKAVFTIDCKKAGLPVQAVREDESYSLTIDARGARLTAPNPLGILRGLETALQLVGADGAARFLPAVTILDKPRFPWRGLLIDVCRHFHPVDVLKRNLDGLAQAKMNVLHWHLSEDQGFRVESRKFPKLHEQGSDGLYYTQAQIKEVVAYARARGIRVIPEFDVPGHTTSWFVGHPELAAGPGPYAIERKFGIFDPTLDPTRDEVYAFLDAFIGEIAPLFPDEYFHIGGDEVTGKQWNMNPAIQAFMNRKGMKTNHDLQMHFNARLARILAKHGKKMVGWDEIAHPDLPKGIVVQSWRGGEGLAQGAMNGYDGILSNGYYLDLQQTAAAHYANDPIPVGSTLGPDSRARILGGESCMWSEFTSSETIDSRIWPRNLAIAERLWSPAEVNDVPEMYRRLEIASVQLEDHGLTHRSNYPIMLERLVGKEGADHLKVLADVVTPLQGYGRGRTRNYTTLFPLTRLVDAARPESDAGRRFAAQVNAWLAAAPQLPPADALRASLELWKKNHAVLGKILESSEATWEIVPQSRDLSEIARFGLEALDAVKSGRQAPAAWAKQAETALRRAAKARAEVDIAVLPAIGKLVVAASEWSSLSALAAPEREAALQARIASFYTKHD